MCMKTSRLIVLSDDIEENKPLNMQSGLAQRAKKEIFLLHAPQTKMQILRPEKRIAWYVPCAERPRIRTRRTR